MAAKLDLTYESRTAAFASILPALGSKYHVGISAFSITKDRLETVNFVNYVLAGSEWAVRPGNPDGFDPADFCGSTIAVQTGSYYETTIIEASENCVAKDKPALDILPFSVQTEAMTRVATGGADAAIAGGATVMFAAEQSDGAIEPMRPVGVPRRDRAGRHRGPEGRHGTDAVGRRHDERPDRGRHLRGHPGALGASSRWASRRPSSIPTSSAEGSVTGR